MDSKKKRLVVLASAGLTLVLAACLALGPLVRSKANRVAERYGVAVEIESVWPAWGGVRLSHVRLRAGASPWMSGDLERVDVRPSLGLGLRALRVRGGQVLLSGTTEQVLARLRDMTHTKDETGEAEVERSSPDLSLEGVRVDWKGAFGEGSRVELEGARVERTHEGSEGQRGLLGALSASLEREGSSCRARELFARFERRDKTLRFNEARIGALEVEVSLENGAALVAGDDAEPAVAAGSTGGPTIVAGGYVGKAKRLRDRVTQAAAWAALHLSPAASVEINGLSVVLMHGSEKLNVGPGSLHVEHASDAVTLDLAPGQSDARAKSDPAGIRIHARVPTAPREIAVHVEGGPVTLASLGVHEQDFGLIDVGKAKVLAKGDVKLSADAERISFDGDGRLSSLSIVHKRLAADPVRGLDLAWRASGVAELDGSLLRFDEGKVEIGAIRFEAFGGLEHGKDFVRVDGRANVPVADCQKMFDSLPRALVPKLEGMTMTGSFALRSGFSFDSRRPDDMKIDWDLKNLCRVTSAPPDIDVERFARPFRHVVYGERGEKVEIVSGPGTADWIPLKAISPFLEAAVTTTEDGGFRFHGGFDKTAIKNSIRDNLRAGKVLRGASTITMQLAKNLYLEREKNLSRKLQEAILTTYLEQALTKDEILELYFNVVEFGPMIYGIGPAADHYFDASPNDLSLGQALFLSSILPAPKRTYFAPTGQVTKGWLGYLHKLMKVMRDRKKINDEELLDGVSEVITYRVARSPRVRPSGDIRRELGGDVPWIAPDGP